MDVFSWHVRLYLVAIALLLSPVSDAQSLESNYGSELEGKNYFRKGDSLAMITKYDSAIFYFEKAQQIFKKHQIWSQVVNCNYMLGRLWREKGWVVEKKQRYAFWDIAIDHLSNAEEISLAYQADSLDIIGKVYSGLGYVNIELGNIDKGAYYFNKVFPSSPREKLYGDVYFHLAKVLSDRQLNYVLSNFYLKKALNLFIKYKRWVRCLNTYRRLGSNNRYLANYDTALTYLKQGMDLARDKFRNTDKENYLAEIYLAIGNTLTDKGDYKKGIEYTKKALEIWEKGDFDNRKQFIMVTYINLAAKNLDLEKYEESIIFCKKALDILWKLDKNLSYHKSIIYYNMAEAYIAQKQFSQAHNYLDKCLNICLEKGEQYSLIIPKIYQALGYINKSQSFDEKAIYFYEKSIIKFTKIYGLKHPEIGDTYLALGNLYAEREKFDLALIHYQKALCAVTINFSDNSKYSNPGFDHIVFKISSLNILNQKAITLSKQYEKYQGQRNIEDLLLSLSTFELAFKLLKNIRYEYTRVESKLFITKEYSRMFEKGVEVALKLYNKTKEDHYLRVAFSFSEQNKANILHETIRDADAKRFGKIPKKILNEEEELRTELVFYETQLQKELQKGEKSDSVKISEYENNCFEVKLKYEKLVEHFEKNYPKYHTLKYRDHIPTVSELQEQLDTETAVIEYLVGEDSYYIFTITAELLTVNVFRKDSTFEKVGSEFNQFIRKDSEKTSFVERSFQLYQKLIGPIETQINSKKKLVIIPDGLLYYIPFEALVQKYPLEAAERVNFSNLDYLIRKFDISYYYSASLYHDIVNHSTKNSNQQHVLAGFAPVFSKDQQNGYFSISSTFLKRILSLKEIWAMISRDGERFTELVFSEKEVNEIVDSFNQQSKNSLGYFYDEATEEKFKQNIGKYQYIHLATHSFINEDNPQLSGIAFCQPADSNSEEDGILYSNEIYNLDLNADLVVLSSCESGLGKFVKGEGLLAMTRGFLYAGAENIVVSLWKVLDKHTSHLMITFYDQILEGKSYSSALRQAKLKMIAQKNTAFPKSWASFILIGE